MRRLSNSIQRDGLRQVFLNERHRLAGRLSVSALDGLLLKILWQHQRGQKKRNRQVGVEQVGGALALQKRIENAVEQGDSFLRNCR